MYHLLSEEDSGLIEAAELFARVCSFTLPNNFEFGVRIGTFGLRPRSCIILELGPSWENRLSPSVVHALQATAQTLGYPLMLCGMTSAGRNVFPKEEIDWLFLLGEGILF